MYTFHRAGPRSLAMMSVASSVLAPGPLHAQTSLDVRVLISAGAIMPRGDVPNAPILSSPTNVVSYDAFGAAPAVGVGVEIRALGLPASLRVKAARSLDGSETGTWGCADASGDPLPCPSILIEVDTDVSTTMATADLAGAFGVGPVELKPLLGVGWLRYSYRWNSAPVGSFSLDPGEAAFNSAVVHYGVAIGVPLGGLTLDAEYAGFEAAAGRGRPAGTRSAALGLSSPIG
jgi:hypothetical protein